MSFVLQPWQFFLIGLAGWINGHQQQIIEYLITENQVLKEKIGKKRILLNDDQRRRLAVKGKVLGRKLLHRVATIVTPDTVLRWHRKLIAMRYDRSASRGLGRPRVAGRIRSLAVRMASENCTWGYKRIQGALANLGHNVCKATVKCILKSDGIKPAPERSRKTTWNEFVRNHWDSLAACDFFTVEVWTPFGLVRYAVFFVMELSTRRVEIAGVAPDPYGSWMVQVARNLTDCFAGFLNGKRYLIHDRDPLYTAQFTKTLAAAGVRCVRLPPKSPNLNAYAERFVRSIKSECLDRMIFFGGKHLRYAINEYVQHYHMERNHQGLGNRLIERSGDHPGDSGQVLVRTRLGGMLKYYYRAAA